MKKTSFHAGWTVTEGVQDPFSAIFSPAGANARPITLPHDAMIEEERQRDAVSGNQYGYYPAKSYTYLKTFHVPESWRGQKTLLEFEGVMRKAIVFLNNEFLTNHENGYTGFFADLTPYLRYEQENTVKVLALGDEKSSRWYPGSGIYRDVWLWQADSLFFVPGKQRLHTVFVEDGYAAVQIEGQITNASSTARKLRVEVQLIAPDGSPCAQADHFLAVQSGETGTWHTTLTVDVPKLWSPDSPSLYECRLKLWDGDTLSDKTADRFGIRTLQLDARQGLRINGKPVKLRGACIHHDNGIIGATTLYDAEFFRLKKLKEAGFNAIRSAHNPASKAMLRACDKLGILVMDEFTDMWHEPKNVNDWSSAFEKCWRADLEKIVDKDFNHPSVILYSLGNEIPEIGRISGAEQCRLLAETVRKLDPTRYTTFGMNGFLAVADDSHLFADMCKPPEQMESTDGSEDLNNMMGGSQQQMLDLFSVGQPLTDRLEAAASSVDVVGYNYLTARHVLEHQLHPDRIVIGSETYPPEIPRLWAIVKENAHVLGDFTWTGFDYLGEAGIGICHYPPLAGAQGSYPDRLAYCGDIDLNGTRRPVSYLREIAYGLRKAPFIAVERVNRYGQPHDENNWRYADCLDSWTFPRYEGKPAKVRVLAGCSEVELFLNGRSLGRKAVGEQEAFTAFFELCYQPGELMAVGYQDGQEIGRYALQTADAITMLQATADREMLTADGQSLAFITVDTLDAAGIWNRWEEKEITVSVEGAGMLLGFGSAAPSAEGSYQDATWSTWDGRVMAVIRSTEQTGEINVRFSAHGCADAVLTLHCTAPQTN